ncbi:MAG: UvrD-helicase domain-containing protein, partial [Planctomycetota bacterium]
MISTDELLADLNDNQREAVMHIDGPLLMLAGPGSGKTRVISHRVAYMISQGVPGHSIVALTFTNKAAEEMKNRIARLVPGNQLWTGTFHRFCSRLIRQYANLVGLSENFTIYDTSDSKKVIKQAIENSEVNLQHHSPDSIMERISNLKSSAVVCDQYQPPPGDFVGAIVSRVYPAYQKLLQMANAVDFDDLLLYAVDLLRNNPELRESLDLKFQYMMVDEYQDTNLAQYQLIRLLNHNLQNLGVTGDPDQSIYGWRGANLNNILEFEQDFPSLKIVRLEQNYRSTQSILGVADQLISYNKRRKPKSLLTDNSKGKSVRLVAYPSVQDEATDIADSIGLAIQQGKRNARDYAILYRTNRLSRSLEHAMRSAGLPYQIVKALEFYQRREVKDVVAYLHLVNNPSDNVAFERIVNVPPRKIGKVTIGRIRKYAMQKSIPMLQAAREAGLIAEISKAAATKVAKFVTLYDQITETPPEQVEQIMKQVVYKTGYRDWLTDDGSEEGHERAANVDELLVAAQEFDSEHPEDGGLERYLEQAALVSDTDAWESESDYVTLMSLHAAKGLEFPCVFIVGLEDGILPHERSIRDPEQIEEERRLLFVGITR